MRFLNVTAIAVVLMVALVGCGGDGEETASNDQETDSTPTETTTTTPTETPDEPDTSQLEAQIALAKEIINQQGCGACHTIQTAGLDLSGQLAPDLSNQSARGRSAAWLRQQLTDPTSIPDSEVVEGYEGQQAIMPSYAQLSDEELDALVAFLMSLSSEN